jgi:hypothetical protein
MRGDDTFVDFEYGINKCVKQVRTALGDDADHPVYLQTVARRGYRFIGEVRLDGLEPLSPGESPSQIEEAEPRLDRQPPAGERSRRFRLLAFGSAGLALASLLVFLMVRPARRPELVTTLSIEVGAAVILPVDRGPSAILSPDGRTLVFVGIQDANGESLLYLRRLDQLEAAPLAGTEGARDPFFRRTGIGSPSSPTEN